VRNAQPLVDSLGRSKILEEELGQLRGMAWSVVTEVLGPRPRSSALPADLLEILGEVVGLITDGVFHGASGVLTPVASREAESSAAPTVLGPGQGNLPVDPAVRLLPSTSSANTDEVL
jgi:hypothetical protein